MAGFQNDPGVSQQEAGFGFIGRFWTESFNNGLTAFAGGGRAGAVLLDSMFNRVTTVATANDSVVLPPINSFPGGALSLCVVNSAVNSMQVFGAGTDTINGVAGATGVPQMAGSTVWYSMTSSGTWIAQGLGSGQSGSQVTYSYADGLTANAAASQAAGTPIAVSTARFTTVASAGNSATLPPAQPGMIITVINAGANVMAVFPAGVAQGGVAGGDQVNTLAQNVAFGVAAGGTCVDFVCTIAGTWHTVVSATGANQQAYSALANTAGFTLTGANLTGGSEEVTIDLTGTLVGNANVQLPTVAALVTAMGAAGMTPQAGSTFALYLIQRSAANTWTVATNTGWTLNGTMTLGNVTRRKFYVTLTSLTAAVLQSIYSAATTGAA